MPPPPSSEVFQKFIEFGPGNAPLVMVVFFFEILMIFEIFKIFEILWFLKKIGQVQVYKPWFAYNSELLVRTEVKSC